MSALFVRDERSCWEAEGRAAGPRPLVASAPLVPLVPLVEYVVAREGLPPRQGLAYDYLLAGDGLFVVADSALLRVRVPVARCAVRGLPPVYASCMLLHGRLPISLWHDMLRLARGFSVLEREVLCSVVHDPHDPHDPHESQDAHEPQDAHDVQDAHYALHAGERGAADYRLLLPHQIAGAASVRYRPLAQERVVLELHSHHHLPAHFSPTDDADEQRLCLYGVIGRLDQERPEVALRVGAYGYFLPLPWESVFAGSAADRAGVHDAHFDGRYHSGQTEQFPERDDPDGPDGSDGPDYPGGRRAHERLARGGQGEIHE